MFEYDKLTAGGGPGPLYQKKCSNNTNWWKTYWNECEDDIKHGLKYHKQCCQQMTCSHKNKWLKKHGYQPCYQQSGNYNGPHFGSIRKNKYIANIHETKMKNLKLGVL